MRTHLIQFEVPNCELVLTIKCDSQQEADEQFNSLISQVPIHLPCIPTTTANPDEVANVDIEDRDTDEVILRITQLEVGEDDEDPDHLDEETLQLIEEEARENQLAEETMETLANHDADLAGPSPKRSLSFDETGDSRDTNLPPSP